MIGFYLVLYILLYISATLYIRSSGGILNNIYFSFALLLYFIYYVYGTYFTWKLSSFSILGYSIEDIYDQGMFFYLIGLVFFILGYLTISSVIKKTDIKPEPIFLDNKVLVKVTLATLVLNYVLRFIGIDIQGSAGIYVSLTQDFLIILTIALYLRRCNRVLFFVVFMLSIFLFSSNFFRYRIYLTVIGLGIVYLYRNPNFIKNFFRYIILGVALFYIFIFFTVNRWTLAKLEFSKLRYDVFEKENNVQDLTVSEGSNVHADFNMLKFYRDNPRATHDYGETMIVFPFVRALPSFFFPNGLKPYPPSLQRIIDSYGGDYSAEHCGKAVSNLFEFYVAFGTIGVVFGMFFFGRILKVLQNRWIWDEGFNSLVQVAILVSLFQYITRGYFPQYVNHIAYLLLPIYLIRRFSHSATAKNGQLHIVSQ